MEYSIEVKPESVVLNEDLDDSLFTIPLSSAKIVLDNDEIREKIKAAESVHADVNEGLNGNTIGRRPFLIGLNIIVIALILGVMWIAKGKR